MHGIMYARSIYNPSLHLLINMLDMTTFTEEKRGDEQLLVLDPTYNFSFLTWFTKQQPGNIINKEIKVWN